MATPRVKMSDRKVADVQTGESIWLFFARSPHLTEGYRPSLAKVQMGEYQDDEHVYRFVAVEKVWPSELNVQKSSITVPDDWEAYEDKEAALKRYLNYLDTHMYRLQEDLAYAHNTRKEAKSEISIRGPKHA